MEGLPILSLMMLAPLAGAAACLFSGAAAARWIALGFAFGFMVFAMFLGAMNFGLHFMALRKGRFVAYWRDPELRFFALSLLLLIGLAEKYWAQRVARVKRGATRGRATATCTTEGRACALALTASLSVAEAPAGTLSRMWLARRCSSPERRWAFCS